MDIKLNIYKDKFCREVERTVSVADFKLSTGICEDIMELCHIDTVASVQGLSEEGRKQFFLALINEAFPYLTDLLKELFDLTDEEMKFTDYEEKINACVDIIEYAFTRLGKGVRVKEGKN